AGCGDGRVWPGAGGGLEETVEVRARVGAGRGDELGDGPADVRGRDVSGARRARGFTLTGPDEAEDHLVVARSLVGRFCGERARQRLRGGRGEGNAPGPGERDVRAHAVELEEEAVRPHVRVERAEEPEDRREVDGDQLVP